VNNYGGISDAWATGRRPAPKGNNPVNIGLT